MTIDDVLNDHLEHRQYYKHSRINTISVQGQIISVIIGYDQIFLTEIRITRIDPPEVKLVEIVDDL